MIEAIASQHDNDKEENKESRERGAPMPQAAGYQDPKQKLPLLGPVSTPQLLEDEQQAGANNLFDTQGAAKA